MVVGDVKPKNASLIISVLFIIIHVHKTCHARSEKYGPGDGSD